MVEEGHGSRVRYLVVDDECLPIWATIQTALDPCMSTEITPRLPALSVTQIKGVLSVVWVLDKAATRVCFETCLRYRKWV